MMQEVTFQLLNNYTVRRSSTLIFSDITQHHKLIQYWNSAIQSYANHRCKAFDRHWYAILLKNLPSYGYFSKRCLLTSHPYVGLTANKITARQQVTAQSITVFSLEISKSLLTGSQDHCESYIIK